MTLAQLKQFFRQKIKVVLGGPPVGTVGSNRSQGLLDVLDKLAEEVKALPSTPGGSAPQALSLADAQQKPFNQPPNQVGIGADYAITGTTWNGGQSSATVYVQGLTPTTYAPTGWVLDANDVLQPVRVDIPAGTYDTKPLRDLQLFQAGDVNAQGEVVLWLGEATTGAGQIKEVLL